MSRRSRASASGPAIGKPEPARRGEAPRLLGAVLAGGESTRFGAPKWAHPFAHTTLAGRALAALAPHVAQVVVVGDDPALERLGVERLDDAVADAGPLAGVVAALERASGRGLHGAAVLACDLPLVEPPLVGALVARLGDADAAVVRSETGPQPLCAVYSTSALPPLRSALDGGERSPRDLLGRLGVAFLSWNDARSISGVEDPLVNVNRPEDLARAEAVRAARRADAGGRSGR